MSIVGSDFVIKKTLVASTAHVEQEDFNALHETDIMVESYEYGARVYLCQEFGGWNEPESVVEHVAKFSFSEGFRLLILFAVSLNCSWLELDSDGPIYEEFPEYEW